MTPNQRLQFCFMGGGSLAIMAALAYLMMSPQITQMLISVVMFLNVAGAILSATCGDT